MIELNETPIRTSRNFNINNIRIEDINFPKEIQQFNNVEYICNNESIINDNDEQNVNNYKLTYGIGDIINNLQSNKNINLILKSEIKNNVEINFKFDYQNINLLDNINILAEENSVSNVILKYETTEQIEQFHRAIIKLQAKQNAVVNIVVVNILNNVSNNFISIENTLFDSATVNYVIVDFGGKNSITNYYSNLIGKSCTNNLNSIYLGAKDQLFDLNYIGHLYGEKSVFNMEVQGALKDISKKHFKGTIDFKKGAKNSKGNENEACMLLSNDAKSISLPILLCSEEDVEGNHSCSAGKIAEKELFYIMSRGLEYTDAMKLMVKARFNKILENISNEKLKEKILNEIDIIIDK